ncbi:hypothetical protein [Shewanella sp. SNU WT4]|nr:hypothetical protein [Shewanella sp. SNU WT4]
MAQILGSHFQMFNTTQLHVSGISFGRLNSSMLAQQLLGNNFHGQ